MLSLLAGASAAGALPPNAYARHPEGDLPDGAISVRAFGAVGDGIKDDSAAVNAALGRAVHDGGTLFFPPGVYLFEKQVNAPLAYREGGGSVLVSGYGATLKTRGAVSALRVSGSAYPRQLVVEGLHIDHRDNDAATAGFELVGANLVTLHNCSVGVRSNRAGYAAVLVRNRVSNDPDTGSFWNCFDNLSVRSPAAVDRRASMGICLRGAANGTQIRGGVIMNVDSGIVIEAETGADYLANAVVIDGTAFESGQTGVRAIGAASQAVNGLRIVNCRVEELKQLLSIEGHKVQPLVPIYLAGNYATPGVRYIDNPDAIYVTALDGWVTTDEQARVGIANSNGVELRALSNHSDTLTVVSSDTGRGIALTNQAGSELFTIRQRRGGGTVLAAHPQLPAYGLNTRVSSTPVEARNGPGTARFNGETAKRVSFQLREADSAYHVLLTAVGASGAPYVASQDEAGFVIAVPAPFRGQVNWDLRR